MEEPDGTSKTSLHCFGCLCRGDERKLQTYFVQNKSLKTVLQIENLTLCFSCNKIAQNAEIFIKNVRSNQILLQNIDVITDADLESIKCQIKPLIDLACFPLAVIEVTPTENVNTEQYKTVVYNTMNEIHIKEELKIETNDSVDDFENSLLEEQKHEEDGNVFKTSKDYDDDKVNLVVNELEFEFPSIEQSSEEKSTEKRKVGKRKLRAKDVKIVSFNLTSKQYAKELAKKAVGRAYRSSKYKCEACVKGFHFKKGYELHMEKHKKSNGEYECDICTQRMTTKLKMKCHIYSHLRRFKCLACGMVRAKRLNLTDHFLTNHSPGPKTYRCPHCSKEFHREVNRNKHVSYIHNKNRMHCPFCRNSYTSKQALESHVKIQHPMGESNQIKNHICEHCGKALISPGLLERHIKSKHSRKREYYCVECDKHFKTATLLKNHLNKTRIHTKNIELPLPCSHCELRFATPRDVERHTNGVHLNIKPHQCDQCEKGYLNSWSLKQHRRHIHEGYKRPLKFPCPMCDKIFARVQVLKSHLRTHTGERPYQCSKCPAQFAQSGSLVKHMKSVHFKK